MLYLYYCKSHSALEKKKRHSAIILSSKRVGDLLGNFVQLWEAKYFKIFSMKLVECYTGKVAAKMLWRKGEEIKGAETSPGKPEMILQTNADSWEHRSFGSETPSSMAFYRRPWKSAWVPTPGSWVRDHAPYNELFILYIILGKFKKKENPTHMERQFLSTVDSSCLPCFLLGGHNHVQQGNFKQKLLSTLGVWSCWGSVKLCGDIPWLCFFLSITACFSRFYCSLGASLLVVRHRYNREELFPFWTLLSKNTN